MELRAEHLLSHNKWAVAYHSDGDGFGAINIVLNHMGHADLRLYSIDNAKRDFSDKQYKRLMDDIDDGCHVLYLDLSPSNMEQIDEILSKTTLLYIDHHQMTEEFSERQDRFHAHNPRLYDPDRREAYAAGLQVYHLFGSQPKDLPFLFLSMFGDAKFDDWPEFHDKLYSHQLFLAAMADAISLVGLTKPTGAYNPERTDRLFEEAIFAMRSAYEKSGESGLVEAFACTEISRLSEALQASLEKHYVEVKESILNKERLVCIDNEEYVLSPILLKQAYKDLAFQGPYVIYQNDPITKLVNYAVMSKDSDYDCAQVIRDNPYVAGGGHTDRAGCTGKSVDLKEALQFFASRMQE